MTNDAKPSTTRAPGIFGRTDLFSGMHAFGLGGVPCTYYLADGLTERQRWEALHIVEAEYPSAGYGTLLTGNTIKVWSAD